MMYSSPSASDYTGLKAVVLRRGLHMSAPVFLIFYLFPDDMWIGFSKWIFPPLMLAAVFGFEYRRVKRGRQYFGLRGYERRRPASFAYAVVGFVLCYYLIPFEAAVPAFFGMGFIDPYISFAKKRGWPSYPLSPMGLYLILSLVWFYFLTSPFNALVLAGTGALVAVAAEAPQNPWLDDDFLMVFVPAVAMYVVSLGIGLQWAVF